MNPKRTFLLEDSIDDYLYLYLSRHGALFQRFRPHCDTTPPVEVYPYILKKNIENSGRGFCYFVETILKASKCLKGTAILKASESGKPALIKTCNLPQTRSKSEVK